MTTTELNLAVRSLFADCLIAVCEMRHASSLSENALAGNKLLQSCEKMLPLFGVEMESHIAACVPSFDKYVGNTSLQDSYSQLEGWCLNSRKVLSLKPEQFSFELKRECCNAWVEIHSHLTNIGVSFHNMDLSVYYGSQVQPAEQPKRARRFMGQRNV